MILGDGDFCPCFELLIYLTLLAALHLQQSRTHSKVCILSFWFEHLN